MEAFTVIRDAMAKTDMFAITRAVFARKERVIAICPEGKGLIAFTLREPSDIRNAADFFDRIEDAKADADMLALARKLVESKTGKFQPAHLEDRYEQRIRELVDAKLKRVKLEAPPEVQTPNVVNLMEALKRSLSHHGAGKKPPPHGSATVHKLPARKARPAKAKGRGRKVRARA